LIILIYLQSDSFTRNYYIFVTRLKILIMAIPSKQIGQSAEANLLWQISKQLEILIKVVSQSNTYTTTTSTTTVAP